jgi:hypothetical protein
MAYAYQDVKLTFDADAVEFVVEDSQEEEIKRLEPRGLTTTEITGLELESVQGYVIVKVQGA